ncbi:hypothetical protein PHET_05508 [Paragonimus heterotremus]|uniref:Uncharacterized protein n=1 Tax=Paragonimus heterotremus TaxID=100268 RepID=A0A8J4TGC8_9TREM|nr:hypothetical protein PHET_05508 [Paragonimus heterotremus]
MSLSPCLSSTVDQPSHRWASQHYGRTADERSNRSIDLPPLCQQKYETIMILALVSIAGLRQTRCEQKVTNGG